MPAMYRTIQELYSEVTGVLVIDLLPHVATLAPEIKIAIKPPVKGLYLPGCSEPSFVESNEYMTVNAPASIGSKNLTYQDILNDIRHNVRVSAGDIQNKQTEKTIKRMGYERIKHLLTEEPTASIGECDVAIACALQYLDELCKYVPINKGRYQLNSLIKPQYAHLLENETFEVAFDALYIEVMGFAGKDPWCYYFYKVKGTTLVIEKGLDYRIVEWHKQKIKASPGYDHDLGGVHEDYEIPEVRSRAV